MSPGSLYCPLRSPPTTETACPAARAGRIQRTPGAVPPARGPRLTACLLWEISVLTADSQSHVTGINCTSPVLQSRAKLLLCNLSLVLLSEMFHQISCSRKQVDINHASMLGSVRSAFLAKDEGTLCSFKNGVQYLTWCMTTK